MLTKNIKLCFSSSFIIIRKGLFSFVVHFFLLQCVLNFFSGPFKDIPLLRDQSLLIPSCGNSSRACSLISCAKKTRMECAVVSKRDAFVWIFSHGFQSCFSVQYGTFSLFFIKYWKLKAVIYLQKKIIVTYIECSWSSFIWKQWWLWILHTGNYHVFK